MYFGSLNTIIVYTQCADGIMHSPAGRWSLLPISNLDDLPLHILSCVVAKEFW